MKSLIIYPTMETNVISSVRSSILNSKVLQETARLFSLVLEEKIDTKQSLHIIHAHIALIMLILLGNMSPVVAVLMLIWFGLTAYQCKRSLNW
ncbi:MAG: hypothetical protein HUK03_01505 [Bacteroidaceae bacterium]|nr:hypothetical protein [Bacteroidaceae bacterium]